MSMGFKPIRRLEYIEAINSFNTQEEAHFRSVVHQAYYAGLNQTQYEIDNRLFFPMDGQDRFESSHKALEDACHNQSRKLPSADPRKALLATIANNLRRSKQLRQFADYQLDMNIGAVQAQSTINYVKEIFNCLEKYE